MKMNKITTNEIKKIVLKIKEGLAFRTFDENKEIIDEYYKENEIYKKGTFHYNFISPPVIFNNTDELKKDLKNVLLCEELKEELKTIK